MNSETPSTSIQRNRAGANPPAAITPDRRMHLQDQLNSRDVVLAAGAAELAASRSQPWHQPRPAGISRRGQHGQQAA